VPTANSAASNQPINNHARRAPIQLQRLALVALGVVFSMTSLFAADTVFAPAAAASASPCSSWNSTTRPPDYIRVLRRSTGRVQRVPFRKYVVTVMGKEWPSYLPREVIYAGAVAVKQFGWYQAMGRTRVSRRGQCFDVTDGTGDQLYKPGRARVRPIHYAAVDATWNVRLLKGDWLFMTGYRTGYKGHCGYDRTGWKLYARSATRCARRGMDYTHILNLYYGPVSVTRWGNSAAGGGATTAAETESAVTFETTVAPITSTQADLGDGGLLDTVAPPVVAPQPASVAAPTGSDDISQNAFTAG
jgi:hypothetical protein